MDCQERVASLSLRADEPIDGRQVRGQEAALEGEPQEADAREHSQAEGREGRQPLVPKHIYFG